VERCVDGPVHTVVWVVVERAADDSDDATREEREPDDLVGVHLSFLQCGRGGTENLWSGALDGFESLAGHEEADQGTEELRIEAERRSRFNCERAESCIVSRDSSEGLGCAGTH
jgi:hypothetical protein